MGHNLLFVERGKERSKVARDALRVNLKGREELSEEQDMIYGTYMLSKLLILENLESKLYRYPVVPGFRALVESHVRYQRPGGSLPAGEARIY